VTGSLPKGSKERQGRKPEQFQSKQRNWEKDKEGVNT